MRNLIALSGRAGSGKDTVGSIIQYLTLDEAFSKTNKDILADLEYDGYCANKSSWEIKKFAGKLKTIAALLSGVNIEDFEDQEFKKQRMTADWGMTYREFLQRLGTEAMRDGLHEEVWVNALFADYRMTPPKFKDLKEGEHIFTKEFTYPKWIITDMRFPNEMEAVKERNGITIRVNRRFMTFTLPDYGKISVERGILTGEEHLQLEKPHPSETALDDAEFDYVIENDGSIEELIEKVRDILIKEQVL